MQVALVPFALLGMLATPGPLALTQGLDEAQTPPLQVAMPIPCVRVGSLPTCFPLPPRTEPGRVDADVA
jgi:hypothetical protein